MKAKKLTIIFAFIAILGMIFAACEGPEGPAGNDGQQGPSGPQGGAVEVWDSSTPSKRIGVYLEGALNLITLLPNGNTVPLNAFTGETTGTIIYFTQVNQQGDPYFIGTNVNNYPKRVFYNPNNGGKYYKFVDNPEASKATGYSSTYDAEGTATSSSNAASVLYKLQTIEKSETGIPEGITGPLVFKIAE